MDSNPTPTAAGSKRARSNNHGSAATASGGGAKKQKASSPRAKTGQNPTAKQIAALTKKEQKVAPETKELELPSIFIRLLCSMKVEDFQWDQNKAKPIFVCNEHDTVANVFRGLIRHNLQSVPVTTKDMEKYRAFIDLADIVRYVVKHFGEEKSGQEKDFWELVKEENTFEKQEVRQLEQHPYAARNRYHAVQCGASLFSVFDAMAKMRGLRRVAIVDSKQMLLNLITQSQLVEFLADNIDLLGAKGRKTLEECGRFVKKVITVKETDKAIMAFRTMEQYSINGIGIVDEHGRLKGNLSVRDLKLVSGDLRMFWRLQQTVKNFVLKLRAEFQTRHQRPQRLVFAHLSDPINVVIKKLAQHKIHRLYVVDARREPIGLISLRDVILEVITEAKDRIDALVEQFREGIGSDKEKLHEPHPAALEGYDMDKLDAEPVVAAPLVPLVPGAPAPPQAAVPAAVQAAAPCCPQGLFEMLQAQTPLQIVHFEIPPLATTIAPGTLIPIQQATPSLQQQQTGAGPAPAAPMQTF